MKLVGSTMDVTLASHPQKGQFVFARPAKG